MKIEESFYVLKSKGSVPMKFFDPEKDELSDDFRTVTKFKTKVALDTYVQIMLKEYKHQGLDTTDGYPFCQYEPMRVNVTWEF